MTITVFVGPTCTKETIHAVIPQARVEAPIQLGDLFKIKQETGDVVVIIDGLFHHSAPVRHKEILEALAAGVHVVGASSMGAIRACELERYGMVGIGEIFKMFRDGLIEADDEVAVVHTESPDYKQLSEPLVNIRKALTTATAREIISDGDAGRLLEIAKGLHYASRSWPAIHFLAKKQNTQLEIASERVVDLIRSEPQTSNLKLRDAIEAVEYARSLAEEHCVPDIGDWARRSEWRTTYLAAWQLEFRGCSIGGKHVSCLDILRYRQLYDEKFPADWRRYVLETLALSVPQVIDVSATVSDRAIAAAEQRGLVIGNLTNDQIAYWVTPEEVSRSSEREIIELMIVRSYQSYPGSGVIIRSAEDCSTLMSVDDVVLGEISEALAVNEEIKGLGPRLSIADLKIAKLVEHLCKCWGVDAENNLQLTAAARDRGFPSIAEAITASRTFFLSKTLKEKNGHSRRNHINS